MRYDALDSWRGICATMVMVYHFAFASHLYTVDIIRNAFLFVDFFFVLSGFVIAINYQERLMSGFGIGRFMMLRLGRVWPLHVAILALYIIIELFLIASPMMADVVGREPFGEERFSVEAIFTNLLLIHSLPGVHENVTWNGPSWSISVEFYTYLIFAAGLWIVSKLPRPNVWLILGLIGILVCAPVIIYMFGGRQNIFLTTGGGLIRCVFGFAAGVSASMLFTHFRDPIMAFFANRARATVIEVVVLLGVIAFASSVGLSSVNLIAPFVFLVAIIAFAPQAGAISSILTTRPLLYIGALSYSIYMVHYIVMAVIYMVHGWIAARTGVEIFTRVDGYEVPYGQVPTDNLWLGDLWAIGISALVIGLSSLTYHFIEKPGRTWMRDRVSGPRRPGRTVAPKQTPSV
jgi:peptidoglycan/LPS O-acetylase OafA/YrhL